MILYFIFFEDTIKLDEIIISPLSAEEIVMQSIKHIDTNYLYDEIRSIGSLFFMVEMEDSMILNVSDPEIEIIRNKSDYSLEINKSNKHTTSKHQHDITDKLFDDFRNDVSNIFYFDHIIHQRGFLNSENLALWDFDILGYTIFNKTNIIIITANYIDYRNKLNHTGEIYINEEDYGILKVDFNYTWVKRN